MNNDIVPTNRRQPKHVIEQPRANNSLEKPVDTPLAIQPKPRKKKRILALIALLTGLIALGLIAGVSWYSWALKPVDSSVTYVDRFTVDEGMTAAQVGEALKKQQLIRSQLAFSLFLRMNQDKSSFQAGTYQLSKNQSVSAIVDALQNAKAKELVMTFYPGATLRDPRTIDDNKRTDVVTMLKRAGFSDGQINEGLLANYDHPLLADKPAGTSLEGYVYGETYHFDANSDVKTILEHTFDVYYQAVKESGIIDAAKARGLNLYQAITLASIVQREVSDPDDMKIVAQVFYKRLAEGIMLGSDVTFIYAADQMNVPRAVNLDSPYNTRVHTGLPPGPIATPGKNALIAVANPASTDYLYFVAGDDGNTYFGKTEAEHQANVDKYCHKLCSEL